MTKENLPLELWNKHKDALNLPNPLFIDNEEVLFEKSDAQYESAVIFLPKSRPLIDMTLAFVSNRVIDGGIIILAGTKKAGIESAKKSYEANIGTVDQKIVGNHSALYVGKNKKLGAVKKIPDFLSYSPIEFKNASIEAASLPGVFSAGELDEGTKLLLENIPYKKLKVLDIGCGAGIIGSIYKKTVPESTITMSDSSLLAIEATKSTLAKNSLDAEVVHSDVFKEIKGSFDLILTNPPFHTGIETDYSFIEKFAKGAKEHLAPNGEVYVVANSFLSYRETLEKNIGPTVLVTETKKFKIFRSKR